MDARAKVETQLGALKDKQAKMAEQLKGAVRARDSTEAGLKTTERQFEEVRKELHYSEINLAMEKHMVIEFHEELRKAREAAQLLKEATEAEKQAAYALGGIGDSKQTHRGVLCCSQGLLQYLLG